MKNLNNTKSPIFLAGACGQTVIQRAINESKSYDVYINECKKLTDEYIVPCSVFTFNGQSLQEAVKGYFVATVEATEKLADMKEPLMKANKPAVLIKEHDGKQVYQAGSIYESLSEIPAGTDTSKVFSIKNKSYFE